MMLSLCNRDFGPLSSMSCVGLTSTTPEAQPSNPCGPSQAITISTCKEALTGWLSSPPAARMPSRIWLWVRAVRQMRTSSMSPKNPWPLQGCARPGCRVVAGCACEALQLGTHQLLIESGTRTSPLS